jgi:hypothetical protein
VAERDHEQHQADAIAEEADDRGAGDRARRQATVSV